MPFCVDRCDLRQATSFLVRGVFVRYDPLPRRLSTVDRGSVHVRGSGYVCAPPVGLQHGLQGSGEAGEVAVVDTTVVQLVARSSSSPGQSRRVGASGTRTSTRRSMTATADRPEPAARACAQARCRQVAEHHLGIGPRLRGVIGPPHQPQVVAAVRRSRPSISARARPSGPPWSGLAGRADAAAAPAPAVDLGMRGSRCFPCPRLCRRPCSNSSPRISEPQRCMRCIGWRS